MRSPRPMYLRMLKCGKTRQNPDLFISAIRPDKLEVSELIDEDLRTWWNSQGIYLHLTAPYSPSQDGVAKRISLGACSRARCLCTRLTRNSYHQRHHLKYGTVEIQASQTYANSVRPYG